MTCPVCKCSDTAYLTCNRPDCTDGRHIPSAGRIPVLMAYDHADEKPPQPSWWQRKATNGDWVVFFIFWILGSIASRWYFS